jgi:hypothetical protein
MENMANCGCLRYIKSSPNTRKVFKRIRRMRGKNLCVHGEDAKILLAYSPNTLKRHKSVYIFVNNNTNVKIFWILSIYTIWDGLSQKTISRYYTLLLGAVKWQEFTRCMKKRKCNY